MRILSRRLPPERRNRRLAKSGKWSMSSPPGQRRCRVMISCPMSAPRTKRCHCLTDAEACAPLSLNALRMSRVRQEGDPPRRDPTQGSGGIERSLAPAVPREIVREFWQPGTALVAEGEKNAPLPVARNAFSPRPGLTWMARLTLPHTNDRYSTTHGSAMSMARCMTRAGNSRRSRVMPGQPSSYQKITV